MEDDGSGATLTIWAGDANAFEHMSKFITRCANLESLELKGMSIVDHIGDLVQAVNRPQLKTLKLPLNGIEAEYCLYFNHLLSFDSLTHLDLSSNWFGVPGLSRFKHTFKRLSCLKVLNLSNNKLCADEGNDTREFRDCLYAVASTLEELYIDQNQIKDPEMTDFLLEPIA
jgi:Ran GTPase-activating protein (RanGAP) involved in mRNA processing and transport